MKLRFAKRKTIAGLDHKTDLDKVWLRRQMFTPDERNQLVAALQLHTPSLDEAAIFSNTMKAFDGLAETSIEWWDIVDEEKTRLYQIWLYGADCGAIFRNGTTDVVGRLAQFGWDGGDDELPAALVAAQAEVKEEGTKCTLAKFAFAD